MVGGVLAVVLAGGLARRMGGGDKGLLPVGGQPVLRLVLDAVRPQVDAIAISANGDPARFGPFGCPVLPDPVPDRPGPLAGVLAGLTHAASCGYDAVLTVPADAPFLPADLVARLRAGRGDRPMAVARSGGRTHPVVALWPVTMGEAVAAALAAGDRRVGAQQADAAVVDWPAASRDPFFNVNTPADLAAANALIDRPNTPP